MVNINNNISIGRAIDLPESNKGTVPQKTETPSKNSGYKSDGYAFDLSKVPQGSVPDVKVGLMDKMSASFKDVLNTEANMKNFVAFENAMKANPEGFLKPGSTDVSKVNELQKKLKLTGMNIIVNGNFGDATEKAVISFKKSVGINDGYLNKNGDFAVTGIVTPKMWNILNSSVAARLNPNGNINAGTYAPPIAQGELNWAKDLSNKITKFGYKPSQSERARYEEIFQRQKMNEQVNSGNLTTNDITPPTQRELTWAKDLINKIQNYGYTPTAQEKQDYSNIAERQKLSKSNTSTQSNQTTQLSQADLDWATNMMQKMKAGYKPNPKEEAAYQKIFQIYSAQQQSGTTEVRKNSAPSTDELKWAKDLEAKVDAGYHPTKSEKANYDDIFARYEKSKPQTFDEQLKWAKDLEVKVNQQGYQPTEEEVNKYNEIKTKADSIKAEKTQNTEQPSETENVSQPQDPLHGSSVEVFGKVGNALNSWNKSHAGQPFPRDNVFYPSIQGNLVSQALLNQEAKKGGDYLGRLSISGNAPALFIPNINSSQASEYKFDNGKIFNRGISNSPAPTQQAKVEVQQQEEETVANVQTQQQTAPASDPNAVSQEELDWAKSFEQNVNQGYKPAQAELDMYNDIFARYQSSGNVSAQQNTAPQNNRPAPVQQETQVQQPVYNQQVAPQSNEQVSIDVSNGSPELKWALTLLDKVQQGYQPSQQEITQYEQIIAQNQAVTQMP